MKKIGKWMVVFVLLIFLFSCKKETLRQYSGFYLMNMTNDTFRVVANWFDIVSRKYTMFPKDMLIFSCCSFEDRGRDSIFIYKYPDTTHVYIKFKYNEEPYNYKLNCFNINDWVDTLFYERGIDSKGIETYNINKVSVFKIEKDKIINP
jgi:hypothetical protein